MSPSFFDVIRSGAGTPDPCGESAGNTGRA